jgi:hypothetical protein
MGRSEGIECEAYVADLDGRQKTQYGVGFSLYKMA